MFIASVLTWLKLPEAAQIQDLDDPGNVYVIRQIIQRKPFLHKIYKGFYKELLAKTETAPANGMLIELGSGAGFLKTLAPQVTTSDILPYEGVDKVFSGLDIPFADNSVSAFMMIDVMHHVKDSRRFLNEMQRCLQVGGKIVMIEPANTAWSKFIYTRFHHEPFETRAGWGFEVGGPLSGANMAIPWIVFCRDRQIFFNEFPNLRLCSIRLHTPFKYLISGGLSIRQLLPSWTYPLVQMIEKILSPFNQYLGMFMTIELEKIS
jgi:SAM-dependent methyltransferase